MAILKLWAIVDLNQALASVKAWRRAASIPAVAKIENELRAVLNELEGVR